MQNSKINNAQKAFEFEVENRLKSHLEKLSNKVKVLTNFQLFKKQYYWLAKQFDEEIEKFYLCELVEKSKKIAIPKIINQEIALYF